MMSWAYSLLGARPQLPSLTHLAMLALAGLLLLPEPGNAKTSVQPYLEIGQVLTADLEPAGPVLTYSMITLGADLHQKGPNSQAQISYRYEQSFGWAAASGTRSAHSGLARAQVAIVPHLVDVDGGILATQVRHGYGQGAAYGQPVPQRDLSQLVSVFGGLQAHHSLGALSTLARYHIGYTQADVRQPGSSASNRRFGDALSQNGLLSIGMAPGHLPFGWSITGLTAQEDQNSVHQTLTMRSVRGDMSLPVLPDLALTAGISQDWVRAVQQPASGTSAAPHLLYDVSGWAWDAGVYWRPSPRTSIRARYGQRRGSDVYQMEAGWQVGPHSHVSAMIYDEDASFGVLVLRRLAGLPSNFTTGGFGVPDASAACIFGVDEAGGCLNGVIANPRLGIFRSRGGALNWVTQGRRWFVGLGMGAGQRDFLLQQDAIAQRLDRFYYGQARLGYSLSPRTSLSSDMNFTVYEDRLGRESQSAQLSLGLAHYLARRWSVRGQIGATAAWYQTDDRVSVWGRAGLRYGF